MRIFFSRRWLLFAIAVTVLAYGAVLLGEWQFHRLDGRKAHNVVVTRNLGVDPVPIDKVLGVGQPVSAQDEWLRITATGTYAEDETIILRYQTRDGASGVDAVTPLVTASGAALLVDRGWTATSNSGSTTADVPDAPTGEVTVVGFVRADATGGSTEVSDSSARALSSVEVAPTVPFPVYGGFVDLDTETPPAATPLVKADLPDLDNGPHFFYGLQWWFFGALAVFGFFYLAWDERRKKLALVDEAGTETGAPEKTPAGATTQNKKF